MSTIIDRFENIKHKIASLKPTKQVNIIAVSKTFTLDYIKPLIEHGHSHFGENKVQEATSKWSEQKKVNQNLKLHMIGKLQSNKAKKALEIFDYIHSLDSQKLADVLSNSQTVTGKKIKYFIQVNVGMETQKAGMQKNLLDDFFTYCTKEKNLDVIGLMAIPPNDGNEEKHFKYMYEANASLGLKELSLGMSSDYKTALKYNATFLRIGSLIFGSRS